LLIHRLQHHDDCPLRQLVLEGRNTERPTRAIRLRDVCPAHWRCCVATRLDAIQEIQEIGFQVCRIVGRRHTVNARSTILAGEPVGFFHPFQVDDAVQRSQRHSSVRSCQFSYPLSFRGQVCETQGSLPSAPRRHMERFRIINEQIKVIEQTRLQRIWKNSWRESATGPCCATIWMRMAAAIGV
jgi:hypothetical protein